MTTKDYVYMALIAFSALVFYMHGFYAGRSLRPALKSTSRPSGPFPLPIPAVFTVTVDDMVDSAPSAHNRLHEPEVRPSIQCVFGHN
jgi:hypothetical protein